MYKDSTNPTILALTLSHKKRTIGLSSIKPILVEGVKSCVWCLGPLKGAQRKWCSPLCSHSAYTWANPQSEEGLQVLLARQDFRCAQCQYDWQPLTKSLLGTRGIPKALNTHATFNVRLMKALKRYSPKGTKPEVDHIIPIHKGGLSIGFDNHQTICYNCHKTKSKLDNSGPRKKI